MSTRTTPQGEPNAPRWADRARSRVERVRQGWGKPGPASERVQVTKSWRLGVQRRRLKRLVAVYRPSDGLHIGSQIRAVLPVLVVFAAALLVRVVYNLTVAAGYVPHFDAAIYNNLATGLLKTHCYCYAPGHPTAFRPPLWPLVITAIYAVGGIHVDTVRMFCAVLGSGTCVLVYFFARDLFGRRVALVTGLIAAVYAGMFIWDGWLFSESLFIFLQMVFLYALLRVQRTGQARWAAVCGVALGLSALARPNGLLLIGLLAMWAVIVVAWRLQPWRVVLTRVALLGLVAIAVTVPWSLRDATVTGSLAPISTIGTTLAGAYSDMTDQPSSGLYGLWWLPPSENADIHPHTAADEVRLEHQAIHWIQQHPVMTRTLLVVHFEHMWQPYLYVWTDLPFEEFPHRASSQFVRALIPWMSYPVFILAGLGLVFTLRRRGKDLMMVYLLFGLTIVENVAFYGSPRFRAPIEPFLVLLVGGLIWWVAGRVRAGMDARRGRQPNPPPDWTPSDPPELQWVEQGS